MPSIVCAGIAAVDLVFFVESTPEVGFKSRSTASTMTVGGCALNAAATIKRLGGTAHLAGVVGNDVFGDFIKMKLSEMGVMAELVLTNPHLSTSRSAIIITPDGERTIINQRDEMLYSQAISVNNITSFDAVLTDTRWPLGAASLLQAARLAGRPGVIDAEAPTALALDALMQASHVAFSEQGLLDFVGGCSAEHLIEASNKLNAWVCVTRGSLPVLCFDGQLLSEIPTYKVTPLDTLGAGDVWHGAFTLGLAEGRSERDAVRRANAVAALKSSSHRTHLTLPDSAEVINFMKENTQ